MITCVYLSFFLCFSLILVSHLQSIYIKYQSKLCCFLFSFFFLQILTLNILTASLTVKPTLLGNLVIHHLLRLKGHQQMFVFLCIWGKTNNCRQFLNANKELNNNAIQIEFLSMFCTSFAFHADRFVHATMQQCQNGLQKIWNFFFLSMALPWWVGSMPWQNKHRICVYMKI